MNEYLAHSATENRPAQTYEAHIKGVLKRASEYAEETARYAQADGDLLKDSAGRSALLHDLGKLDVQNQKFLRNLSNKKHLPVNHVEAGSAALINLKQLTAALLTYSHHRGLPDIASETAKKENYLRDDRSEIRAHTDGTYLALLERHEKILGEVKKKSLNNPSGDPSVFFRMALSCLADADHGDTAEYYGQAPAVKPFPSLRAEERLDKLNRGVSQLGSGSERDELRKEMYSACRGADTNGGFAVCDSPVGSGKTTAAMVHLLNLAAKRGLRRIFVILPYTGIINKSVKVYRESLVLPDENPEEVVAELHSRADFDDKDARYLTSLWNAPIIVTTAVAFFETLASNKPSALRKLHNLPGSAVFVDEAHSSLPLKLLPLAWRWMNILANEWGCYWLLASGSLVKYWELEELDEAITEKPEIAELVNDDLRKRLALYEQNRVSFPFIKKPISRSELTERVHNSPGPQLLILNTVQSAAVAANDFSRKYGRECVEHLSSALTAEDRDRTIERVERRLKNPADDNWTLVATSCVESGIDFSFKTGFREMSSLLSLLQAAGRVNREGLYGKSAIWSFTLQDDSMLTKNPELKYSVEALKVYFERGNLISPALSTRSMSDEIRRNDDCISEIKDFLSHEKGFAFETINEKFKVIDSDTVTAVADDELCELILQGKGDWTALQRKSVSIPKYKAKKWGLEEIKNGIYKWTLDYDGFLGYMRGVLEL